MLCKIADLLTQIPEAGGLAPRCQAYLYDGADEPQVVIRPEEYRADRYSARIDADGVAYMESAYQFYTELVEFEGLYLHASAVALHGYGYLFSGPSGMGKSTHTRLWQQAFGADAQIFNDDKPALRRLGGQWLAYGTPWCGKDGINQNMKVPLAGICFLKQGMENRIRRLHAQEAILRIMAQTRRRFQDRRKLDLMLENLDKLVREIPIYELVNRPEMDAARLSYETMRLGAQEAGL